MCPQFWYGIFCAFSATTIYEQWCYQLYNLCFTSTSIIWISLFDRELSKEELMSNPELYRRGRDNKVFTPLKFWRYIIQAFAQSVLLIFLIAYTFDSGVNRQGQSSSMMMMGQTVFCYVVLISNMEIGYQTHSHQYASVFFGVASVASFFIVSAILSRLEAVPNLIGSFWWFWKSPQFYLGVLFFLGS